MTIKARSWFCIKAMAEGHAEIVIYDEIGLWGVSASDFIEQLRALGDVTHIDLRLNSPGGDVFDGHAIYNLLRSHTAHVTAHVDGVAASIASIIMLAADEIIMPGNAIIMIHDPVAGAYGTREELRKAADVLDKLRDILLTAYVSRTGEDEAQVSEWMRDETWFTAEEALASGLVDSVVDPVKAAAVFDPRKFSNAPRAAFQNLMAPASSVTHQKGENAMTIEQLKAQLQQAGEEKAAIQAKLDSATAENATLKTELQQAKDALQQATPLAEAGKTYRNNLVDQVVQARRELNMVGDTPEDVQAARDFVTTWPLDQLAAEAKTLAGMSQRPASSAITHNATNNQDDGSEPTSFRAKKED